MEPDIEELTHSMIDFLRKEHREISLDYIIQKDPFGKHSIIIYAEYNFNPMGFDFIESRTSWMRPEAVDEYNTLAEDGYCVVVYVPKDQMADAKAFIKSRGGKSNIRLFSHDMIMSRHRPDDEAVIRRAPAVDSCDCA